VIGAGPGAFAEYMVVPAAAAMPVPAGWTAEQALGLADAAIGSLEELRPELLERLARTRRRS